MEPELWTVAIILAIYCNNPRCCITCSYPDYNTEEGKLISKRSMLPKL